MMQQTMLRIKDPVKSLDFYTRILGMTWVLVWASFQWNLNQSLLALQHNEIWFNYTTLTYLHFWPVWVYALLLRQFLIHKLDLMTKARFSLSCANSCRLLQKFDFPSMHFSLFFLGYEDKKEIPTDVTERTAWTFSRRATIELTQ